MTEDEMVGWYNRLYGHEFEQALGDSEGQGSLACRIQWRCKELDITEIISISTVQFICSVVSDSLQPHELWHARPPCPSPTPGVYPNLCPLGQ